MTPAPVTIGKSLEAGFLESSCVKLREIGKLHVIQEMRVDIQKKRHETRTATGLGDNLIIYAFYPIVHHWGSLSIKGEHGALHRMASCVRTCGGIGSGRMLAEHSSRVASLAFPSTLRFADSVAFWRMASLRIAAFTSSKSEWAERDSARPRVLPCSEARSQSTRP